MPFFNSPCTGKLKSYSLQTSLPQTVRPQMFLGQFSFSWEMRIALPTGTIWQSFLITSSPAAFTTGRESFFALCRGGSTDSETMWEPAVTGTLCPLDMASPPDLDKVIRGKNNPSNFSCGHFKTRISYFVDAFWCLSVVMQLQMAAQWLHQACLDNPSLKNLPQKRFHSTQLASKFTLNFTLTHTPFLSADPSSLLCADYSLVMSI